MLILRFGKINEKVVVDKSLVMEFSIEAILTLITGKAFQDGLNEMKRMMAYMLDRDIHTIDLVKGDSVEKCRQSLLNQYPFLAGIDASHMNANNVQEYVVVAHTNFGKTLNIKRVRSPK